MSNFMFAMSKHIVSALKDLDEYAAEIKIQKNKGYVKNRIR